MIRYLARRLGFYLVAAWVALTLNFFIPRLMPGDPATVMLARFQGQLQPEAIEALKEAFGLSDAPLWRQYLDYLSHALVGDLGISVAYYPAPVIEVIWTGLLWTLFLAGGALIISFTLGTALGAVAAWRRGGWLDSIMPPLLAFLGAFPYFWMAMAALFVFGFSLGWFPLRHAYDASVTPGLSLSFFLSAARHAALPALTMVIASLGGWMLAMRNTTVSVLGEDYIKYAHARGLPQRRILIHYAARNALLPNLTGFGMALGFVLSGALLTEIVFSYPGQGYLLIQAVHSQDFPLMQGLFLTITVAVLGANWLVDLAVALLDPRTR
ncbi:MAG: peptide/nickel transport system permease protein [Myxococcota bacterium]|jgi:peptide/nickel transport system permease protein